MAFATRALLPHDNQLWVAHGGGVSAGGAGAWRAVSPIGPALALARDGERLLVATAQGVEVIGRGDRLRDEYTDLLFRDSVGRVWAGSGDPVRGELGVSRKRRVARRQREPAARHRHQHAPGTRR